jgi:hypothetical protein
MESVTTVVQFNPRKSTNPDEYFARRIYLRELGNYLPMRSYERFSSMVKHFNRYIRKHLERQSSVYIGSGKTTYIQFVYDCPSGLPTAVQQKRYIYQWAPHGINDPLDIAHGCFTTPHMLISPTEDMLMLYITLEWRI